MARYYTGARSEYSGARKLANRSLRGFVTPDELRAVPPQYLPEAIAGFGEVEAN